MKLKDSNVHDRLIYLWFKCDSHVTCESGRYGPRGVKIHRHEILQVGGYPHQFAVVDSVRYIGNSELLLELLSRREIFEQRYLWLAGERTTL